MFERLPAVWLRWTEPHESVTDLEARRRARVLGGTVLALIPLAVASAILIPWITNPSTPPWLDPVMWQSLLNAFVALGVYLLSRSRYHHIGGVMLVTMALLGTLAAFYTATDEAVRDAAVYFFAVAVLLSGLVLPIRYTLAAGGIVVALILGIGISGSTHLRIADTANPILFVILVTLLNLVQVGVKDAERHDRLRAEENVRELERKLQQQQKLESIGNMAAGIAHEINNPLHAILNYSEIIRSALKDNMMQEFSDVVIQETRRAAGIVTNLLGFSTPAGGKQEIHGVEKVVSGNLQMLRPLLAQDRIDLQESSSDVDLEVRCDPKQIQQVLVNLVNNAVHALNKRYPDASEAKKLVVTTEKVGSSVVIAVADTAGGIDGEVVGHVFDPFFTTKEPEEGTGLGLAISYSIAREHGGELRLRETSDEGSVFELELPLIEGKSAGTSDPSTPPSDLLV